MASSSGTSATLAAGFLLAMTAQPAFADVILFETGSSHGEKRMMWTGEFVKLDRRSGMVTFKYTDADRKWQQFRLHYSRIYSLEINEDKRVNADLPPFRSNVTTNIGVGKTRKLVVIGGIFLNLDEIPEHIRKSCNEDPPEMVCTLDTSLREVDRSSAKLGSNESSGEDYIISREDLRFWIR